MRITNSVYLLADILVCGVCIAVYVNLTQVGTRLLSCIVFRLSIVLGRVRGVVIGWVGGRCVVGIIFALDN
jgi:hypothetical protein